MSATAIPPPPARKERSRRRILPLPPLFQNPETRSVEIGVAGTILVHLILLLLLPRLFPSQPLHPTSRTHPPVHQFNIEMAPQNFLKPPPPMKFVEANPNANNNIPEKTNNFAAQNQTVAQEKPNPKGKSDMPALEGRRDIHSTQIVTGTLMPQQQRTPPAPQQPVSPPKPSSAAPKHEQNPLAGTDKLEGKDKEAYGTDIAPVTDSARSTPQKVTGAPETTEQATTSTTPKIDPLHPQPRRYLAQHVRPAVFAENRVGTANIGPTALDARWSNYGEYLQRLIESVQMEWDRILMQSATYPPEGSTVAVTFILDSKGRIKQIEKVDSTSTVQGRDACESAIVNRSPYGEWTADMIAMLGQQQEMTFTFYYQ